MKRTSPLLSTLRKLFTVKSLLPALLLTGLCLAAICAVFQSSLFRSAHAQTSNSSFDGLWQDVDETSLQQSRRTLTPDRYRTIKLNLDACAQLLARTPLELSAAAGKQSALITLPLPTGGFARFRLEEIAMMEPELARKFPEIKTYRGRGLDDPALTAQLEWTPDGLRAQVLGAASTFYIEPYAQGEKAHYLSYYKRDLQRAGRSFNCNVTGASATQLHRAASALTVSNGGTLRRYRTAVSATGEYTTFFRQPGDSDQQAVARALAAVTTTLNRVNGIYERELGVRLVLINNNERLIFTDAATDPFTNGDTDRMVQENQAAVDQRIASANYDIGHVFGTGVGGLAAIASICNNDAKAGGATALNMPVGDRFDVDFVAHEFGHQFGANHTYNNNGNGACTTREPSAAFEPASGSTIMGYTSICPGADIQPNSDPYFHVRSLEEMLAVINANSCEMRTSSGNTTPTINPGPEYNVPRLTPFTLTASGSDPNGDALTYCWEQYDLGPASPPEADDGARPLFRSYLPNASPARTFPSLTYILNNANRPPATDGLGFVIGEVLPTTTRTLKFQVTARDNRDGVNSALTRINISDAAGPFVVLAPNTAINWPSGSAQTVTWDVSRTNGAPINAAQVRILLSTDGGNTFPLTLAASTPNDGAETIIVPNSPAAQARIKIEAVGNIFFDISDANFTIQGGPLDPNADLAVSLSKEGREPVADGDTLTYVIAVGNNGPSAAMSVTLNSRLTPGLTPVSCSSTNARNECALTSDGAVITIPNLGAGASVVTRLNVRVTAAQATGATLSNTVTATAASPDPIPGNNTAVVTVNAAPPNARLTLEGNRTAFDFGTVTASTFTAPSYTFTLENTGLLPLTVNFDIRRVLDDVTRTKISDPDDSAVFPLVLLDTGGPVDPPADSATIPGGQSRRFRIFFEPLIPVPAGRTTNLLAVYVIPDLINSLLTITPNVGQPLQVALTGRVTPEAKLINPFAPGAGPLVVLAKTANDEFSVEFSAYDANLDIYYATYQFLDASGAPVGEAPGFPLAAEIAQAGVNKGQSFTVVKKFSGASARPQVNRVRVTLFDRLGNVSATSRPIGTENGRVVNVSAASLRAEPLAASAIATVFGQRLATTTAKATTAPLPTSLAGTRVFMTDSRQVSRPAPLFFVAPGQVNYQVPPRTAAGAATVAIVAGDGSLSVGTVNIASVAPALFAANSTGQGLAAGVALRVQANGAQSYEAIVRYDTAQSTFQPAPIDLGANTDQVYLILFGSGLRQRSGLSAVTARAYGTLLPAAIDLPVTYAGAQGGLTGLDQVNLRLPRTLAGRGEIEIRLTVDGRQANSVRVQVR